MINYNRKQNIFSFIVIFTVVVILGCGKDESQQQYNIPHVPVDFYIQPHTIDYIPVNTYKSYDEEG